MKKTLKRLCTGFLALATVVTALPTTPVHAESTELPLDDAKRVLHPGTDAGFHVFDIPLKPVMTTFSPLFIEKFISGRIA